MPWVRIAMAAMAAVTTAPLNQAVQVTSFSGENQGKILRAQGVASGFGSSAKAID